MLSHLYCSDLIDEQFSKPSSIIADTSYLDDRHAEHAPLYDIAHLVSARQVCSEGVLMLLDIDSDSIASRVQWLLIPHPIACIPYSSYTLGPTVMVPFDPAPHARACLWALDTLEVFRRAFLSYAGTSLVGYLARGSSSGSGSPSAEERAQEFTEIAPERPTFRHNSSGQFCPAPVAASTPNCYALTVAPFDTGCLVCFRRIRQSNRCFVLERSSDGPHFICFAFYGRKGKGKGKQPMRPLCGTLDLYASH